MEESEKRFRRGKWRAERALKMGGNSNLAPTFLNPHSFALKRGEVVWISASKKLFRHEDNNVKSLY